jgi:hypothetical protein
MGAGRANSRSTTELKKLAGVSLLFFNFENLFIQLKLGCSEKM